MKYILFIVSILLISCQSTHKENNSSVNVDSIETDNISVEPTQLETEKYIEESLDSEFNESKLYNLAEVLKADFNGDGNIDEAKFIKGENSGIIIIHGVSKDTIKLGFGNKFAHMTDFNWVNYWAIVNDSVTFEILFKDNEISGDTIVHLENLSIALIKEEACSGLITFKNGEFIWIHQTD